MGDMLADLYALMGVASTATQEDIHQAYQTLTIRLQIDARPSSAARERLQLLAEAYRVLASPSLRAEYDAQRRLAGANAAAPLAANQTPAPTNPLARSPLAAQTVEDEAPLRLSVTLGTAAPAPLEEPERMYVLAELDSSSPHATPPAAPLNLALVVARSVVLRDPELADTRHTLNMLGAMLRPEDQLTLVAFDDEANVLLDGEAIAGREDTGAALDPAPPRGAPRLSTALLLTLERLATHIEPANVSTIVLITDGVATEDEARCLEFAERARQLGVSIVSLGIGLEWNRDALDQLANVTGGTCAYVDDPRYLTHALADLIERLRATLASRLRLTLEPAPGVSVLRAAVIAPELACVFEGPHTPCAPVTVELGALAGMPEARSSVALWETLLEPATLSASADSQIDLGSIHSTYRALWRSGGRLVRASAPVRASRFTGDTPPAFAPDVRLALELLTASRLQARADQLATSGHVEEACAALDASALRLASAGDANLAEEARQAAAALAHGLARAASVTLRARYSVRNQSPFHHLRRARSGKAGG